MTLTQLIWHSSDIMVGCCGLILMALGFTRTESDLQQGIVMIILGVFAIIVGIIAYIASDATDEEIERMEDYGMW